MSPKPTIFKQSRARVHVSMLGNVGPVSLTFYGLGNLRKARNGEKKSSYSPTKQRPTYIYR
jgi:hypothetical protein